MESGRKPYIYTHIDHYFQIAYLSSCKKELSSFYPYHLFESLWAAPFYIISFQSIYFLLFIPGGPSFRITISLRHISIPCIAHRHIWQPVRPYSPRKISQT